MEEINLENIGNLVDALAVETPPEATTITEGLHLTPHRIEDYDQIEDSFIRYRVMVNDALDLYETARLMASVSDTGLSASIERMSAPFRKGFFTLAVVGKVSAGKSTFINALLGKKDLLPTGYLQTTCTLTTISHNEKEALHVIYGDFREETITEHIGEALSRLVAIDPKYDSLPVNNINRLVLGGKSKEDICGENIIKELEKLSKNKIDKDLLKDYLKRHPKEKIPMEVAIECPLNEDYRGWRIVDTPGVDAVGGIEDDTRRFLCGKDENGNHNVDAIIFIQPAKGQMQEKSLNDFVSDTIGSLTEEARKRSFFVLTHATNPDFIVRKDEIWKLAKQLFVDYAGVGDDNRLIAVDSLAALLENDSQLDFKTLVKKSSPTPLHWDSEVWMDCRNLIQIVQNILLNDEEIEFNNENTRNKLRELANFDTFRNYLNSFVKSEKSNAFNAVIEYIEKDINACVAIRQQDLQILGINLGQTPEAFLRDLAAEKEKLDNFQIEINSKFLKLSKKYGKSKVDLEFKEGGLMDVTPSSFNELSSLQEMRKKAETMGNLAERIAQRIQDSIIKDVDDFCEVSQRNKNFKLPLIDYKSIASRIETQASQDSDRTRQEEHREVQTITGFKIRYKLGKWLGMDLGGERVWYETVHYTDNDAAAISFSKNLKEAIENYKKQIVKNLDSLIKLIDEDIKTAIRKRKADYDKMAENTNLVDQMHQKEQEIRDLLNALSYLEIYHGIN